MLRAENSTKLDLFSPCPFLGRAPLRCRAAIAKEPTGRGRGLNRCQSDDHDNCPLFMAKLLRSSPVERSGAVLNLHLK
jgi:hypothetical protein